MIELTRRWAARPEALGEMVGAMLWLAAGVAVAVMGIWYPFTIDRQFGPEVDTRMGFVYVYTIQLVLAATVAAGFALRRLYRGSRYLQTTARALVMTVGILLALGTSSPIFAVGLGVVRYLAWGIHHPDV